MSWRDWSPVMAGLLCIAGRRTVWAPSVEGAFVLLVPIVLVGAAVRRQLLGCPYRRWISILLGAAGLPLSTQRPSSFRSTCKEPP